MSTLLQLGLIGLLCALIPVCWVWVGLWRAGSQARYRKLVWVTLFLTLDLIMVGGFTRLTDSGLGCPDWPGCYGASNPVHAADAIRAAETALPTGPVTAKKAWIEMVHRYMAMMVGALICMLAALAWKTAWQRWRSGLPVSREQSPWFGSLVLALVCLQGAFGAWTVTLKLQPVIVTLHLLLGMTLLGVLTWWTARSQPLAEQCGETPLSVHRGAILGLLLLVLQIALGGWVSTNYAVLACTDFPLCNGRWLPPMDFAQGFTLWRPLGQTASGEWITREALVAIHWTHRVVAVVVVAGLAWLGWRARRDVALRIWANGLLLLLALQIVTGLSNVLLDWPLFAAVAHNGGAAGLLMVLVRLVFATRAPRRQESDHRTIHNLSLAPSSSQGTA